MKNRIIKINDISEINTSKASVYDLNNRYIDPQGNMYGLKYNWALKKVEIVKLMRTHAKDASQYHQKMIMDKIDKKKATQSEDMPSDEYDHYEEPRDGIFNPEKLIEDIINITQTHKERLKGIMMNINNSNVFPKENKADSIQLEDIFRNIEIEGIQRFDNLESYQRELISYPRSISYYHAKMDPEGRNIIELLSGHKEKTMRFIYLFEMYKSIKELYQHIFKLVSELSTFVSDKHVDEEKSQSSAEKQYFHDARTSIDNTISEINQLLDDLRLLHNFTREADQL
ncbi:MAG: hypothetical protein GY754_32540 [bacterium]|nr:hypothetical protein [bacterium]